MQPLPVSPGHGGFGGQGDSDRVVEGKGGAVWFWEMEQAWRGGPRDTAGRVLSELEGPGSLRVALPRKEKARSAPALLPSLMPERSSQRPDWAGLSMLRSCGGDAPGP